MGCAGRGCRMREDRDDNCNGSRPKPRLTDNCPRIRENSTSTCNQRAEPTLPPRAVTSSGRQDECYHRSEDRGNCCRRQCRSPECGKSHRSQCPDAKKRDLRGRRAFGGGLNCHRCDKKVYQAEMQIVSGRAYHRICFSCFCCRKPLEPFTLQEHCGDIFCKQCYIRNFGPQGYGYGMGAGVLQTPL